MVWVDIHGPLKYQQYCDARLGKTPREAALAHFHGPLAIGPSTINWKVPPDMVLTRGDKPGELQTHIGTMSDRHQCWVVVVSHTSPEVCSFAEGIRPKVTIEFPAKEPGAPAITEQYSLDGFCWGCLFDGPVRVPEKAATGKAKVTFSFDSWLEGRVEPTTIELPVVDPQPKTEESP